MDGEPNPDQFRRPGDPLRIEGTTTTTLKPSEPAFIHERGIRSGMMTAEEEAILREIKESMPQPDEELPQDPVQRSGRLLERALYFTLDKALLVGGTVSTLVGTGKMLATGHNEPAYIAVGVASLVGHKLAKGMRHQIKTSTPQHEVTSTSQ